MIKISERGGFTLTFENGYTASVQFGYGNYCDNRNAGKYNTMQTECKNAEVACIGPDGKLVHLVNDTVQGWMEPDELVKFLKWCSELK